MKVVETFVSINGEGQKAGELAVFVRFQGCNLACSYCDTSWANETACPYQEMSPSQIVSEIKKTKVRNVTLTGGEPLLQEEMASLLQLLQEEELQVEIETNGSVDLSPFLGTIRPSFTMDYKLPSSGCEGSMKKENFSYLTSLDTVKFVAGSIEDLEKARQIIETYNLLGKVKIYISPVFGKIKPEEIVQYMIEHSMNQVRLQIQMHKVIWDPDKRGV